MTKKRIIELTVKVVVAALTAFLTALSTTSCMGLGPVELEGDRSREIEKGAGSTGCRLSLIYINVHATDLRNRFCMGRKKNMAVR